MAKRFSYQRIKRHRDYTVAEAAEITGAHSQTVIRWIRRDGLPALTERRPWLISGQDLKEFLGARAASVRRQMDPHQFFCLKCKCPREAALKIADYTQTSATSGMMTALCAACDTLVYKTISRSDLETIRTKIEVAIKQAATRLVSQGSTRSNVLFGKEGETHVKAQG